MKSIESDIAAIGRIGAVPGILRVASETTGLRPVLTARVTEDSWTACATLDRMDFGLRVGDHLNVADTLCREVRGGLAPVVIARRAGGEGGRPDVAELPRRAGCSTPVAGCVPVLAYGPSHSHPPATVSRRT